MKMKNRPMKISLMKKNNALKNKNKYANESLSVPVKIEHSMDTQPWEKYLNKIYYDPAHPASFAGPQKLQKVGQREGKYKIGLHNIRKIFYINRMLTVFINPLEDDSDEITLLLLVKMTYGCVI